MEDTMPLYLMLSQTPSRMGRMIRRVTRYPYNHISLTLDPSMTHWVSFARYTRNMPFYGGFIQESAERYLSSGKGIHVRIFRLEIPQWKHQRLEALFSRAGRDPRLVYNLFEAVATVFGRKLRIPNAYTCLSFAGTVLGHPCRTLQDMDRFLTPWLFFEGELAAIVPDSGCREDRYFADLSLVRGSWNTARNIAILTGRIFRPSCPDLVTQYLH